MTIIMEVKATVMAIGIDYENEGFDEITIHSENRRMLFDELKISVPAGSVSVRETLVFQVLKNDNYIPTPPADSDQSS